MACINGLIVMVSLSTCIAEAFDTADAYLICCFQSLDTHGEESNSSLQSIVLYEKL